jgi:hypothetical protein
MVVVVAGGCLGGVDWASKTRQMKVKKSPRAQKIAGHLQIGSSTGNPGVRQANPDPYPQYPVPLSRVPGFTGRGQGYHGFRVSISNKIPILGLTKYV